MIYRDREIYGCITPERPVKTSRLMTALAIGWPGVIASKGPPPAGAAFIVWGQLWTAERLIPAADSAGTPYIQIDNGYMLPSGGQPHGFYRLMYRGQAPINAPGAPPARTPLATKFTKWRTSGRQIVVAVPGSSYGRAQGINLDGWAEGVVAEIVRWTDRPVLLRTKGSRGTLTDALRGAFALVTYGSAAAVEAIRAGVPVFCSPLCAAAPVGLSDLSQIERPVYPERGPWWDNLMAQQFTIAEMRNGFAYRTMRRAIAYADEAPDDRVLRPESLDDYGFNPATPGRYGRGRDAVLSGRGN